MSQIKISRVLLLESHFIGEMKISFPRLWNFWKLTYLLCWASRMTDWEGLIKVKFSLWICFCFWTNKKYICKKEHLSISSNHANIPGRHQQQKILRIKQNDLKYIIRSYLPSALSDCRLIGAAAECQVLTHISIYWTYLIMSHHWLTFC